eukprot:2201859-Rhodomonas_salina.1
MRPAGTASQDSVSDYFASFPHKILALGVQIRRDSQGGVEVTSAGAGVNSEIYHMFSCVPVHVYSSLVVKLIKQVLTITVSITVSDNQHKL